MNATVIDAALQLAGQPLIALRVLQFSLRLERNAELPGLKLDYMDVLFHRNGYARRRRTCSP
jgi:hypothetical protein